MLHNSIIRPLRRLRPKASYGLPTDDAIQVHDSLALIQSTFWAGASHQVLNIAPSMLRIPGGYTYGDGHPMVQALNEGPEALARFYHQMQPENLASYYDINDELAAEASTHAPNTTPWYMRKVSQDGDQPAKPPYQFFGPATDETIAIENERLSKIVDSIGIRGYRPELYSFIGGYVLRSGDEASFVVTHGKHRAAVLTSMGQATIPVVFHRRFPRLIDKAQSADWPAVVNGEMSQALASRILDIHVAGRDFTPAASS